MTTTYFRCFAHRGASGYAPENTLLAFQQAIDLGATWIECDVHRVENEIVVIHDRELSRTTSGKGKVDQQTLTLINGLDAGRGEKIPTLDETLALIKGKARINIELKGKATAIPTLNRLNEAVATSNWQWQDFLISSFDHRLLSETRAHCQAVPIGVLYPSTSVQYLEAATTLTASSLHLSQSQCTQSLLTQAHQAGFKVFVYTVNDPNQAMSLQANGVDGVFSDYPDRILTAMADLALISD